MHVLGSVEQFALIWLAVIASLLIGVLLFVSPVVGVFALIAAVVVFFGLRWIRRERQMIHRVYPGREEDVEPEEGDVPDEPSYRRTGND